MSNFKLKQSLKKKSILLTFLTVCSLLILENALARYGKDCCVVKTHIEDNCIDIYFKFFEYQTPQGGKCSYIEDFEIQYSTDDGNTHHHLMTAWTEEQRSNTWAWIECKGKKPNEQIYLYMIPHDRRPYSDNPYIWKDGTKNRFKVGAATESNVINFGVEWYPKCNVTHIQINVQWYNYVNNRTKDITLDYKRSLLHEMWNAKKMNFSNSSPKQEMCTEEKNNSVKAYKEANAIVIEGALDEKIQVCNTTGVLVKSVVADCDMLQIPVPANQLYIVKVGQASYKVAL